MRLLTKEIRSKEGVLHFRRYRLLELFFFRIYLHNILVEDQDTHLHGHPWNFLSIVLKGSYEEFLLGDTEAKLRTPGSIAHRTTEHFHKIAKVLPGGCWTLVFAYGFRKPWGLKTSEGIIPNEEYRRRKAEGTLPE